MSAASLPESRDGEDALTVAERVAREAGALIRAAGRAQGIDAKGRNNLVTETDFASERLLLDGIAAAFPDHAVLSEESHPDTNWTGGWVWVLDPLDGTRNFVAGIPNYCVNVGLLLDGEAVLGVTYDPNRDQAIVGGPGLGVRVNGQQAPGPQAQTLADSMISVDLGYDDARAAQTLRLMGEMWPGVQAFRMLGSAAMGLAWTAAGFTDLNLHALLYPWDLVPGLALVPASGGVVLDREGAPARPDTQAIVAGSPAVVDEFLRRFGTGL